MPTRRIREESVANPGFRYDVPSVALTSANSLPAALTAAHLIGAPYGCWYDDTSGPSIAPAADAVAAPPTVGPTSSPAETRAQQSRRRRAGVMALASALGRSVVSQTRGNDPNGRSRKRQSTLTRGSRAGAR